MPEIWCIADTHFNHSNVIKYCNRPFASVEEMDDCMIQVWNELIKPEDTVCHIGDLCLEGRGKKVDDYISKLNGKITLIRGNHDSGKGNFEDVTHYKLLKVAGFKLILSHYAFRVWDGSHHGSMHLYGHSHGTLPGVGRSMDVGVDTNNYRPYHIEEVIQRLQDIPVCIVDQHTENTN